MTIDKKSFVLYTDIIHSVELLTDEESGKLFKHILRYVNNQKPILDDRPIKQNLKRDLEKYLKRVDVAKQNGTKGGRPKITKSVISKPKKGVNDNDNDNGTVTVIDTDIVNDIFLPFQSKDFFNGWNLWKAYKKDQFNFAYKSKIAEQSALKKLTNLSGNNEKTALLILEQSVANGWKGLFEMKEKKPSEKKSTQPSNDYLQKLKNRLNG